MSLRTQTYLWIKDSAVKIPNGEKYFGTSWERGKSSVFPSVSGSLYWVLRVCWERPGGCSWKLKSLCTFYRVYRFCSGCSEGLNPERLRLGVAVIALLLCVVRIHWDDQHGDLFIMQFCLCGHFLTRKLSWKCQFVSQPGVNYHHSALGHWQHAHLSVNKGPDFYIKCKHFSDLEKIFLNLINWRK